MNIHNVFLRVANWFVIIIVILTFSHCFLGKKSIMDHGKVKDVVFFEEIVFEDPLNLVILPVSINGETYRFLFDTGAPNVISPDIQKKWQFKKIGKNLITDSQGNSEKVEYVTIESLKIGSIDFSNTAACIIDFKSNPVLNCLDLDGIIGSNLMQFCTWQVNFYDKTITLTNLPESLLHSASYVETIFKSNDQRAIKIDFTTGNATIKNIKIDYGSTGSISVPDKIYGVLYDRGDLSAPRAEVGFSNSGIFGEIEADTIEISVVESGKINGFEIDKFEISSSGRGLLGTKILKNYIVTMNWPKRTIGFERLNNDFKFSRSRFGFSPTFHDGNVIVKSIIIDGPAHQAGLLPGMIINSLDDFLFEDMNGFCQFVLTKEKHLSDSIRVEIDLEGTPKIFDIYAD